MKRNLSVPQPIQKEMVEMSRIVALTAALALLPAFAGADSFTGVVEYGEASVYTFDVNKASQIAIDLIWEERVNHGFFLIECEDGAGYETTAYGYGQNPRGPVSVRMSAAGGSTCFLWVTTAGQTINFIVTVQAVANRALQVTPLDSAESLGLVWSDRQLIETSREGELEE